MEEESPDNSMKEMSRKFFSKKKKKKKKKGNLRKKKKKKKKKYKKKKKKKKNKWLFGIKENRLSHAHYFLFLIEKRKNSPNKKQN